MKIKISKVTSVLLTLMLLMASIPIFTVTVHATITDSSTGLKYSISNNEATITGYSVTSRYLSIPNTLGGYPVTSIGDNAFANCSSLQIVYFPSYLKEIGNDAFYNCTSLTDATFPSNLECIDSDAFKGCKLLASVTFSSNLDSIENCAFQGCTSLTSVTIPSSVTYMNMSAFKDCNNLTDINVDPNNNNYSSVNGVLFSKDKTQLLEFPFGKSIMSYSIPSGVTSIEDNAFENCKLLSTVIIPDGVKSISYNAFSGCTSLTSVTIPESVNTILDGIFQNCTALKNINLPSSLTSISSFDFNGCTSLTSITIPQCVTSIGEDAFLNCTSLKSVTIPQGVTSIGKEAFSWCTALTSIIIPNSVTSIGADAFFECTSLQNAIIQSDSISIDSSAFDKCSNVVLYGDAGSSVQAYAKQNLYNFVDYSKIYTATFYSNGGSTVDNQTGRYYTILTAPTDPTKSGYTFKGWYTALNSGIKVDFPYLLTADITFYAHWTVAIYTVTFNSNGGTDVASQTASYNTTISAPTTQTKTGYTFTGWYKDAACTTLWNFSTDIVTADTTLYAGWTINTYTVTFNSNGGIAVASQTASYNTTISAPTAPTKAGYTFAGWYKDVNCTILWTFTTDVITANTTLYAGWNANGYIKGDVNGDGVVSLKDASSIQKYLAGVITLNASQITAADILCNGTISLKDATRIQKYLAGIITSLN
ncbi:MAG: leucine-rich repeat protein [Bacillota bacterium]|nr:leucine-rich repeat protein [Bacillota bacterium]